MLHISSILNFIDISCSRHDDKHSCGPRGSGFYWGNIELVNINRNMISVNNIPFLFKVIYSAFIYDEPNKQIKYHATWIYSKLFIWNMFIMTITKFVISFIFTNEMIKCYRIYWTLPVYLDCGMSFPCFWNLWYGWVCISVNGCIVYNCNNTFWPRRLQRKLSKMSIQLNFI